MWRCLDFDCKTTTEVSRCRSFSNATLFRKITAVAVELSRDLMWLALLGVQPEGGGALYNGLYGKALPKKDTFLRVQVYERAGISYERVWEICHCGLWKDLQGLTGAVYGCKKSNPMVLLQNIKVMQRYKVVCERGTIFQWQEYERGIFYAKNGI